MSKLKVLMLNEMMYKRGTSYTIRHDIAKAFSKNGKCVLISPSFKRSIKLKKINHDNNFTEYITPGILPTSLRRGGFGILDLFFKIFIILSEKPNIVYATTGHRPSQFFPSIISKFFLQSYLVDERWEYYGKEGRFLERKNFIGKIIGLYDVLFEKRSLKYFNKSIAVTNYLKKKLESQNVIFCPGVVDFKRYSYFEKYDIRKELNLLKENIIVGLLSLGTLDHDDYEPFYNVLEDLIKHDKNVKVFVTGEKKYINNEIFPRFGDALIYKGWLDQIVFFKYLSACDFFILPLNDTPRNLGRWPIKFNDFFYFRRPIIISDGHEISSFCKSNPNIKIYKSNKISVLQKLVNELVSLSINNDYYLSKEYKNCIDMMSIENRVKCIIDYYNLQ